MPLVPRLHAALATYGAKSVTAPVGLSVFVDWECQGQRLRGRPGAWPAPDLVPRWRVFVLSGRVGDGTLAAVGKGYLGAQY